MQGQVRGYKNAAVVLRIQLVRVTLVLFAHQRAAVAKQAALQRDKEAQAIAIKQLQAQVRSSSCFHAAMKTWLMSPLRIVLYR